MLYDLESLQDRLPTQWTYLDAELGEIDFAISVHSGATHDEEASPAVRSWKPGVELHVGLGPFSRELSLSPQEALNLSGQLAHHAQRCLALDDDGSP